MKISMHQASAPRFANALRNLSAILDKAQAWSDARKIDPAVPGGLRLIADMFPLSRQVQIACDIGKTGTGRIAAAEAPKYEDNEATFPELIERARKTIAWLETLKPEQFDDGARMVSFPVQKETKTMPAARYLYTRVLPNVFFHCATTYNILRHNGVEIGKGDFLGPIKD